MVTTAGQVDAERLDYALRRRDAGAGPTWNAQRAIAALAYASCQHMMGTRRVEAQKALEDAAAGALQALVWPGQDLWCRHMVHIEIRRWQPDEALPVLTTRGSFEARGARLAAVLFARMVSASTVERLGDPAQRPVQDEDDRYS